MERFLRVEPEIVAHDLHPEYVSTVYARERPARPEGRRAASPRPRRERDGGARPRRPGARRRLRRHGLRDRRNRVGRRAAPAAGSRASSGWRRSGRYRSPGATPPSGSRGASRSLSSRTPFPKAPPLDHLPLLRRIEERALQVVLRMLEGGLPLPLARGAGRYFDGFGALFLARPFSRHEGQVAFAWNVAANPAEGGVYPYALDLTTCPPELDLRPTLRAAVEDFLSGRLSGSDLRTVPQHAGEGDRRARQARRRAHRRSAGRA